MRGPQFTLGGAAPLTRPLAKKFHTAKRVFHRAEVYVKFQHSSCNSFGDMMGSQIYIRGAAPLTRPSRKKFHIQKEYVCLLYTSDAADE